MLAVRKLLPQLRLLQQDNLRLLLHHKRLLRLNPLKVPLKARMLQSIFLKLLRKPDEEVEVLQEVAVLLEVEQLQVVREVLQELQL